VCFSTPDEASKAVAEMNSKMLGSKPLYVAPAQKKNLRKAHLEAQFSRKASMRNPPPANSMAAPLYASNTPLFYAQPQGFVYPPQTAMIPRTNRWGAPPQIGQYQPIPNYVVQMQRQPRQHTGNRQNPQAGNRRGGGGGFNPARGGGRIDQRVDQGGPQPQQQPSAIPVVPLAVPQPSAIPVSVPLVPDPAVVVVAPPGSEHGNPPIEALAQLSSDDQAQYIGEKLYPLIAKTQPEHAGKITGMLLERYTSPLDMIVFLDNPESLQEKVNEAMEVLQAHGSGENDHEEPKEEA